MLILTLVAPVLGTNCYLVATEAGGACVVVDPGGGIADPVAAVLDRYRLTPVGMVATHGHVDHTWDAATLGERYALSLTLHEADAYRLDDPFGTLGPLGHGVHDPDGPLAQALSSAGVDPSDYRAPRVDTFTVDGSGGPDGSGTTTVSFGEISLEFVHAPGHTEGAGLFLSAGAPGEGSVLPVTGVQGRDVTQVAFTGDVLFAGTIGRTDLPGGDAGTMSRSLAGPVARLEPATLILPGHGPGSTMRDELSRNPFLTGAATP